MKNLTKIEKAGSNDEQNGGRKSRWTVPLKYKATVLSKQMKEKTKGQALSLLQFF